MKCSFRNNIIFITFVCLIVLNDSFSMENDRSLLNQTEKGLEQPLKKSLSASQQIESDNLISHSSSHLSMLSMVFGEHDDGYFADCSHELIGGESRDADDIWSSGVSSNFAFICPLPNASKDTLYDIDTNEDTDQEGSEWDSTTVSNGAKQKGKSRRLKRIKSLRKPSFSSDISLSSIISDCYGDEEIRKKSQLTDSIVGECEIPRVLPIKRKNDVLECSSEILSSMKCRRKNSFSFAEEIELLVLNVVFMGGGLTNITAALDLDEMAKDFKKVGIKLKIYLLEKLPTILSGASQTTAVCHAGGGEYLHAETKAYCQIGGSLHKKTYPNIYSDKDRPIKFPNYNPSVISNELQIKSFEEARQLREQWSGKPTTSSECSYEIIPPEVLKRSYPNLDSAILSKDDVPMKIHELHALLKKCLEKSNIEVITDFTVEDICEGVDGFKITGVNSVTFAPLELSNIHVPVAAMWNNTKDVLVEQSYNSSVVGQLPVASSQHDSFVSFSEKLVNSNVEAAYNEQNASSSSGDDVGDVDYISENRVLALLDLRDVSFARRDPMLALGSGFMMMPTSDDMEMWVAYRCLKGASYPADGRDNICAEEVLSHGKLIYEEINKTLDLPGIKFLGAKMQHVVLKKHTPLSERTYQSPFTKGKIIVGMAEKATYARVLALEIDKMILQRLLEIVEKTSLQEMPESKKREADKFFSEWISAINKIIPDGVKSYKEEFLPAVFVRGSDITLNEMDILKEKIDFINSFELTEIGLDQYNDYIKKLKSSVLLRSRSLEEHSINMSAPDFCTRSISQPLPFSPLVNQFVPPSLIDCGIAGKQLDCIMLDSGLTPKGI